MSLEQRLFKTENTLNVNLLIKNKIPDVVNDSSLTQKQ